MLILPSASARRCVSRRTVRRSRPTIELLESRQLLSVSPLVVPSDLSDPLIAPVATAEYVQDNGRLTRTDVINLLNVVDGTESAVLTNGQVSFTPATPSPQAALTASQLTDLQSLDHDHAHWGLTPDATNLLGKVVYQNPANLNYQGAPLLPSGQLTAGTADSVVQDLVGKWFYGADLPDATTAAVNAGVPDTVVYQTAQGTLFGPNGPSQNDIAQGWLGDCYFMSALGAVARQAPQAIENMFINNGDGTYTVRFFELDQSNGTWHPDYVTVNLQLPVLQQSGQFAFADWYQYGQPTTYTSTSAALWPALAEKAYAQLAEEGWSRQEGGGGSGIDSTPADWDQNSYDALNAGNGAAVQQLTGSNITNDIGLAHVGSSSESALETAFAHGTLITIGSLAQEPSNVPTNSAGAPLIIPGHVYSLKSVNTHSGTFELINPFYDNSIYPGDGQRDVTLTWSQLKAYLNDAWEVAPPPICPGHAVLQKGSNTGINGGARAINIKWFDNGVLIASPSLAHEGDTVTITFDTDATAPRTEFSLVSYAAPNSDFNDSNLDHQQEWADATGTWVAAGHHSLTVVLPDGFFQLDFVKGAAISDFATGETYHGDNRFIAGADGGDQVVTCGC
jgi:hypothetical protein